MKTITVAVFALASATSAGAHEIWVERDGAGPARIYLGEPAEPMPAGGDPEFAKLKAPRVLSAPTATQVRRTGHIEVAVPPGDVRVADDAVFAPWGPEGKRESVTYFARAGRQEARAVMPFELAPVSRGSDRFVLTREGRGVPNAAVTVIAPDRSSRALTTDAKGMLTVAVAGPGRYLLTAAGKDEGRFATPGGEVAVLHRITTKTFVAP